MIWWLVASALAGDLSGTVTDAAGTPVDGATVVAYDQRLNYATAFTDASGAYTIEDIPPNPYRVRVLAPQGLNLVEQYLPDTLVLCTADVVSVPAAGAVEAAPVSLSAGVVLAGQVVARDGTPVADAELTATPADGALPLTSRTTTSGPDGAFQIAGVAPGQAQLVEVAALGWPEQLAPGVYLEELAQTYTGGAPGEVPVGDVVLLDGIVVSGTAVGPSGPVDDGQVHVYSPSQLLTSDIVDGAWEIVGLPPGDVLVWAVSPGLGNTYFPDADRPVEWLPVSEGEIADGLELVLPAEARITGTLVGPGDLSDVSLLVYNDDRTVGIGVAVASDGTFEAAGLHGGTYTIQVFGARAGLVDDMLRDEGGAERIIELPHAGVADLGALTVPLGATVQGTVTDRYTGEPVYGAYLYAQPLEGELGAVVAAEHDGSFVLDGLRADTWTLWADYRGWCTTDADWAVRYYPDHANQVFVGAVTLAEGEVFAWDPLLAPDDDHDSMDDVWEEQMGLDPSRDDGAEDPDGDGYTNLEEYLLGTDPRSAAAANRGCGCGGGRALVFGFLLPVLARRRRDRHSRR